MSEVKGLDGVTRVEVIERSDRGRVLVEHTNQLWADLQDDGRTLKIFLGEQPMPNQDNDTVLRDEIGKLVEYAYWVGNNGDRVTKKRIEKTLAQIKAHYISRQEVEAAIPEKKEGYDQFKDGSATKEVEIMRGNYEYEEGYNQAISELRHKLGLDHDS